MSAKGLSGLGLVDRAEQLASWSRFVQATADEVDRLMWPEQPIGRTVEVDADGNVTGVIDEGGITQPNGWQQLKAWASEHQTALVVGACLLGGVLIVRRLRR